MTVTRARHAGELRWTDLRAPLLRLTTGPNNPTLTQWLTNGAGSAGVYAYHFSASATNQLFGGMQFPHSWAIGTNVRPHIHWAPTTADTGNVLWRLEYTIADIGGTFGNTTVLDVLDAGDGTANKHQIASWSEINMSGFSGLSCMFLFRVARVGGDGTDTYTDPAVGLEFDLHYQQDDLGSQNETTK